MIHCKEEDVLAGEGMFERLQALEEVARQTKALLIALYMSAKAHGELGPLPSLEEWLHLEFPLVDAALERLSRYPVQQQPALMEDEAWDAERMVRE